MIVISNLGRINTTKGNFLHLPLVLNKGTEKKNFLLTTLVHLKKKKLPPTIAIFCDCLSILQSFLLNSLLQIENFVLNPNHY